MAAQDPAAVPLSDGSGGHTASSTLFCHPAPHDSQGSGYFTRVERHMTWPEFVGLLGEPEITRGWEACSTCIKRWKDLSTLIDLEGRPAIFTQHLDAYPSYAEQAISAFRKSIAEAPLNIRCEYIMWECNEEPAAITDHLTMDVSMRVYTATFLVPATNFSWTQSKLADMSSRYYGPYTAVIHRYLHELTALPKNAKLTHEYWNWHRSWSHNHPKQPVRPRRYKPTRAEIAAMRLAAKTSEETKSAGTHKALKPVKSARHQEPSSLKDLIIARRTLLVLMRAFIILIIDCQRELYCLTTVVDVLRQYSQMSFTPRQRAIQEVVLRKETISSIKFTPLLKSSEQLMVLFLMRIQRIIIERRHIEPKYLFGMFQYGYRSVVHQDLNGLVIFCCEMLAIPIPDSFMSSESNSEINRDYRTKIMVEFSRGRQLIPLKEHRALILVKHILGERLPVMTMEEEIYVRQYIMYDPYCKTRGRLLQSYATGCTHYPPPQGCATEYTIMRWLKGEE